MAPTHVPLLVSESFYAVFIPFTTFRLHQPPEYWPVVEAMHVREGRTPFG
jgi:hypothetical protein